MWICSFLIHLLMTIKCYSSYLDNITSYDLNNTVIHHNSNHTNVKSSLQKVSFVMDWKDTREELYHSKVIHRYLKTKEFKDIDKSRIQRCKDSFEAYSASYFITKEHLIYQFTDYNLTWVNCEMGSFIFMTGRVNPFKDVNGSLLQSIDLLDFSVIHLSTYERLQKRWMRSIRSNDANKGSIEPVRKAAIALKQRALQLRSDNTPSLHAKFNRTIVIMPFLGADMGAGHSKLSNRFQYLAACFWSFYADFPYISVAVKSKTDYIFARNTSGLPFYEVILLENLPKSASLPVATSQETKRRIISGQWDFDYIFFTESDQILMNRIPGDLYDYLDIHPRHVMIPHRLMVYPIDILTMFHKRNISNSGPYDWMDMKCCLPRQHCTDRKSWLHIKDPSVIVLNIYGLQVALGNADFHREKYRNCTLDIYGTEEYCS